MKETLSTICQVFLVDRWIFRFEIISIPLRFHRLSPLLLTLHIYGWAVHLFNAHKCFEFEPNRSRKFENKKEAVNPLKNFPFQTVASASLQKTYIILYSILTVQVRICHPFLSCYLLHPSCTLTKGLQGYIQQHKLLAVRESPTTDLHDLCFWPSTGR